ncbi:MAG TPA: hypothetical protein VN328_11310 [Thermodesulfovibrionales bacterium]|nr:hypothetical protein [Thermodesulfovibrionales bacterium]
MTKETFPLLFYCKTHLRVLSTIAPIMLSGVCGVLGTVLLWLFLNPPSASEGDHSWFFVEVGLLLFLVLFSTALVIVAVQSFSTFLSYLRVSQDGLECNLWPTYHIQCSWNDVQAITKRYEIMDGDVMVLCKAAEIGRPITTSLRKKLGLGTQYFIPLDVLDGWPAGKLADTIRYYAPQLFDIQEPKRVTK